MRVALAVVVADRVGSDQKAEGDRAAGQPAEKPASEPVAVRVRAGCEWSFCSSSSHFIAAANMSGIPTERTKHQPAGDEAEAGRADPGQETAGSHRKVVEGVFQRMGFERLIEPRHHHEHHHSRCDEHGGQAH